MWGKWVGCSVPVAERGLFDAAQRAWSVIADQPGLVGQLGGWDPATGRAHVLGLWRDVDAYGSFMRERHDAVAAGSHQGDAYAAIETATGEVLFTMSGDADGLPRALATGTLLRVADCRPAPDRAAHFLDVQRRLWAPGMAAAGGMLGGAVTRLGPDRYLVTTLWTGPEAHGHYTAHHLPGLRARAAPDRDLRSITGHVIPLEARWRVLPER
ncbi:DUF4937 domain-containing protein [Nocardiopsis aegyptia]|uniref:DUF4937 domain-containing protein n=1 Tax=Nocardiopsis aegyptia TaxID=220378 RepID=UPI003672A845